MSRPVVPLSTKPRREVLETLIPILEANLDRALALSESGVDLARVEKDGRASRLVMAGFTTMVLESAREELADLNRL